MTNTEVGLRPVTQDEFDEWLPRQQAGYAEQIVASGWMLAKQAREKAALDTAKAFTRGLGSPRQFIFRLVAGDEPVGWLWLALPHNDSDPEMAWVNDVEIDAAYRGRGFGRQAMLLAEQEARKRGMTSIGLNVHGQNTVARALYDSLGYQIMTQQLKKPL
jgi:ribosomal protein S18 acetylase RimI-like enzyme